MADRSYFLQGRVYGAVDSCAASYRSYWFRTIISNPSRSEGGSQVILSDSFTTNDIISTMLVFVSPRVLSISLLILVLLGVYHVYSCDTKCIPTMALWMYSSLWGSIWAGSFHVIPRVIFHLFLGNMDFSPFDCKVFSFHAVKLVISAWESLSFNLSLHFFSYFTIRCPSVNIWSSWQTLTGTLAFCTVSNTHSHTSWKWV